MAVHTYSTYDAKARFSELLRRVRAGDRVIVTYHGKAVAEIAPVEPFAEGLAGRIEELARAGAITPPEASGVRVRLTPVARHRGALARFLESRD